MSEQSLPHRQAVVESFKAAGGRIAAVYPIHYPRALLRAHGFLPMEIWGPPGQRTTSGDAHLQAYTCSIVRGGLSWLLDGGLDVADLVLVPHGCDSLQGLGTLLQNFVATAKPVLTVYSPRGGSTAAQVRFLAAELRRLSAALTRVSGVEPGTASLMACVEREESADAVQKALMEARPTLALGERDFYRLLRSREYLPAEDFLNVARAALAQTSAAPASRPVPLLLSGVVPEPMGLLELIEEAGGSVVADDLACSGRRFYPAGQSCEPFERMAQSLLGGPPHSMRGSNLQERTEHLLALAKARGVKGCLFYIVKFCEPELFYLPQLRKALEAGGLPSTVIEGDVCDTLQSQTATRVQAFLETLS